MSTILDAYFRDIRKSEPLSSEKEIELAKRIQKGDRKALNELVEANTKFVVTVARNYQGRGLELCDLISEGNIGLIKAAERFEPDMGFRFISYAVWWIRQSILMSFSNSGRIVRLPLNIVGQVNQINKARELFEKVENRLPSDLELSKLTGIPEVEVRRILLASTKAASLDIVVGDDEDGTSLGNLIEDKDSSLGSIMENGDLAYNIQVIMKNLLTDREIEVVSESFGIECEALDDETIGKKLAVSPERVRQLREKSLKKIRGNKKAREILMMYLG